MRKRWSQGRLCRVSMPLLCGISVMVLAAGTFARSALALEETTLSCVWLTGEDDRQYWYEGGVRQGTPDDGKGVVGDGTVRGREIYDPASDGWYWLDAVYDGAKAVGKEVWIPYVYQDEHRWGNSSRAEIACESDGGMSTLVLSAMNSGAGKWVRYDENGRMLKGWVTIEGALTGVYPDQAGNRYYYDTRTGLMAKGTLEIGGRLCHFNEITGVCEWEEESAAPAEAEPPDPDAPPSDENGSWKTAHEIVYNAAGSAQSSSRYFYNESHDLTGMEQFVRSQGLYYLTLRASYTCDEQHLRTQGVTRVYHPDSSLSHTILAEYADGKLMRNTLTYADAAEELLNCETTFSYDYQNGSLWYVTGQEVVYPFDRPRSYREEFAYAQGSPRLVQTRHYNAQGALEWTEDNFWTAGRIQRSQRTSADGALMTLSNYIYNGNNDIMERVDFVAVEQWDEESGSKTGFGDLQRIRRIAYAYDDKSHEIERLTWRYDESGQETLDTRTATTYYDTSSYLREKTQDTWYRRQTFDQDTGAFTGVMTYGSGSSFTYYDDWSRHEIRHFGADDNGEKTYSGRTAYARFQFPSAPAYGDTQELADCILEYDAADRLVQRTDRTYTYRPDYRAIRYSAGGAVISY